MTLDTLVAGHPREVAIEAAYYAVRELKQSSVPKDVRKAHLSDASESEPTAEAQALSAEIVQYIERAEGRKIDELQGKRKMEYITQLFKIAEELTASKLQGKTELGPRLREQLRRG